MSEVVLRSDGLRKEFGTDDRVLTGADLDVREGEILVLMGPNGVGKTVLLSCFAGSEVPTAGSVEVFGEPVRHTDGKYLNFMLQDSVAIEKLSGRENAEFYAGIHPRFTDRWESYVEELGLADDLDKLVEHYSEGMKRKLEFSLTMSGEVPIYLLDEPTAGVDLTNIQRFHDIIGNQYDRGKTFVVSSHRPMDANIADRLAFMPDGSISAVGTPEALLEAVSTVVTVRGRASIRATESLVRDEQLFPVGGEARGFLKPEADVDDVRNAVDNPDTVDTLEPTYTDLFNYYVHVEPES